MEYDNQVPFKAVTSRNKLTNAEYIQRRDANTQNELLRLTQDSALSQLLARRRKYEIYQNRFEIIGAFCAVILVIIGVVAAFIYVPTLTNYSKSLIGKSTLQQYQLNFQIQQEQYIPLLSDVQQATMNELYSQIAHLEQQQKTVAKSNISKLQAPSKFSFILSRFVQSNPEYQNFDGTFCPVFNFANFFAPRLLTCPSANRSFGGGLNYSTHDKLYQLLTQNLGVCTVMAALVVSVLMFSFKKRNSVQKIETLQLEESILQNRNVDINKSLANGVSYEGQQKHNLSLEIPVSSLLSQDGQQLQKIVGLLSELQNQVFQNFKEKQFQSDEAAAFCAECVLDNGALENLKCREVLDLVISKLSGFGSLIGELEYQLSQSEVQAESWKIGLQQQEESYQEFRKVTIEQMDQIKTRQRQTEKHNADLQTQIQAFEDERDEFREKESSLLSSISQLEFEFEQLTKQKESSIQEINLKQLKIAELEAVQGVQTDNLKSEQSQMAQLKNKLKMEEQTIQKQKDEIQRKQSEIEDYKFKVQALNSQMDKMSESLLAMENSPDEKLHRCNDNQVKQMQDKLWMKESEYSELQKDHDSLQQQIKWLQQSHDDLNSKLHLEKQKVRALDEEKQQQVEDFQTEYSQMNNNIIQLVDCNEELLQKCDKEGVQGSKKMMQFLLEEIFMKELQIIMSAGDGGGSCDEYDVDKLKTQIICLNNDRDHLQMEVQRLSSGYHQSLSSMVDNEIYKQRTELLMQELPKRVSDISKILGGSISSPEHTENQQATSSAIISEMYDDFMKEIYSSQSYVPVMEVEEHYQNLKENGCFVDLSDKENTSLNDQSRSSIDSGMCEQIENIIEQYAEVEEKLSQKVFDKANIIYHSMGLNELVDQNISEMESLESIQEKSEQEKQQLEQLQKCMTELVADEEKMIQCLNDTQKEIEDLQESQDGLYRQYYDVTKAAINMQDGPTDTSRLLLLGQSLSPIQSHSSAERIAENEQDYADELISGGESSLPQTPFKQYNCRSTNQESEGGVSRSLNIVSHCPSDQSSFSVGDESVESAASPTLQHLGRQLFQDEEESSPLIAQHSQFFTPPHHNTFQRSVVSESEEREDQTDIFKDDSKKSGDVFGNMGTEQDASTSRTLFMMPKGGYPQTPFSTPNNQQQENNSNMQNLGLPRAPLSPRE